MGDPSANPGRLLHSHLPMSQSALPVPQNPERFREPLFRERKSEMLRSLAEQLSVEQSLRAVSRSAYA